MKEGWTYKSLDEIANINYGTRVVQKKDGGSIYPVYGGGGATFKMDTYNRENCLVVARFAMSPQCTRYVEGKFFLNDSGLTLKTKDDSCLLQSYLDKCILGLNDKIYLMSNGMAQKNLDVKSFRQLVVHYPSSITEQQQIVSELDLLSGSIEKQKAQIEELDKLAQSIFYDMFGDPATNPKSWDIKTIGEIGTVERGAGISKKDFVADGIPCIHYGQLHTCLGAITHKHITCIPETLLPKYKIAHTGDVIMAITSEDVDGSCTSTAWLGKYDIVVGSDAAILHHSLNGVYISYYTRTKAFFNEKAKYAKGFKVTHISTSEISSIHIPIPPLSLQQAFAEKIEAIEAMKSQIRQSLKESEQLFNSRMDYYFN